MNNVTLATNKSWLIVVLPLSFKRIFLFLTNILWYIWLILFKIANTTIISLFIMVVATLQHTFSGLILKKQIYNDISQPNQPEIHFEHMVQAQIHEK